MSHTPVGGGGGKQHSLRGSSSFRKDAAAQLSTTTAPASSSLSSQLASTSSPRASVATTRRSSVNFSGGGNAIALNQSQSSNASNTSATSSTNNNNNASLNSPSISSSKPRKMPPSIGNTTTRASDSSSNSYSTSTDSLDTPEDAASLRSYNEMLKTLLSKEISSREAAEKQTSDIRAEFESFRVGELATLQSQHQENLKQVEEEITQRVKLEYESKIDTIVNERVSVLRQADSHKYHNLDEIQSKLTLEFEDRFSQTISRLEREKKELGEKLQVCVGRLEQLTQEQKHLASVREEQSSLISALEYRCSSYDQIKSSMKSYKLLCKYLSCKLYITSYRVKKYLHSVYHSLCILYEKLNVDIEYQKTSDVIIPQHELEVWLDRTHQVLSAQKMGREKMKKVMGVIQQFQIGSTNTTSSSKEEKNNDTASSLTYSTHPNTVLTNESYNLPSISSPLPPLSSSTNNPPPPSITNISTALQLKKRKPQHGVTKIPHHRKIGGGGGISHTHSVSIDQSSSHDMLSYTKSSSSGSISSSHASTLPLHDMLLNLSEVEVVLRGCLIECLHRANEWKISSENFFERNQELVQEMMQLREVNGKQSNELKNLSGSLQILEKSMNHIKDERKALREIDAQAPPSSASRGGVGSNVAGINVTNMSQQRGGSRRGRRPHHHHLQQHQPSHTDFSHTTTTSSQAHALDILTAHARSNRLAHLDATSSEALIALDASELDELTNTGRRANSARSGSAHSSTNSSTVGNTTLSTATPHSHSQRYSASSSSNSRGFFDHHNAVLKMAISQKQIIEGLRRNEVILKGRIGRMKTEKEKRMLREKRRREEEGGQSMNEELTKEKEEEQKEQEEIEVELRENTQSNEPGDTEVNIHPISHSSSSHSSPHGSEGIEHEDNDEYILNQPLTTPPLPTKRINSVQQQQRNSANIGLRPMTSLSSPYSPVPIFPRPFSSHSVHPHANGSNNNNTGPRPQHLNLSEMDDANRPTIRTSIPFSPPVMPVSPYGVLASMNQQRPGSSGQVAVLSMTQPLPNRPQQHHQHQHQVITTSSQSYAATQIYSPPQHSGSLSHRGASGEHGARAADRVYGVNSHTMNSLDVLTGRPRTTGTMSSGVTSVITGDQRYDVISPYVSQSLPWERKKGANAPLVLPPPSLFIVEKGQRYQPSLNAFQQHGVREEKTDDSVIQKQKAKQQQRHHRDESGVDSDTELVPNVDIVYDER